LDLNDRKIDIIAEGFDLAIRIGILEDSTLIARKIAPARLVTIASPDYLERYGTPSHPRELENHNCLAYYYAPNPYLWTFADEDKKPFSIKISGRYIGNNGNVAAAIVMGGGGIVRLPLFICWQLIETAKVVPILQDYQQDDLAIYAVYPHNRHLSAKVRAFVDFMVARFGGDNCYWEKALE